MIIISTKLHLILGKICTFSGNVYLFTEDTEGWETVQRGGRIKNRNSGSNSNRSSLHGSDHDLHKQRSRTSSRASVSDSSPPVVKGQQQPTYKDAPLSPAKGDNVNSSGIHGLADSEKENRPVKSCHENVHEPIKSNKEIVHEQIKAVNENQMTQSWLKDLPQISPKQAWKAPNDDDQFMRIESIRLETMRSPLPIEKVTDQFSSDDEDEEVEELATRLESVSL